MDQGLEETGEPSCKKVKLGYDNSDISPVTASTDASKLGDRADTPAEISNPAHITSELVEDVKATSECADDTLQEADNTSDADVTLKPLTEVEAGITEYFSDHTGFSAVLKQRYSDFNVNEIDQEGNVIHLTDMSLPSEEEKQEDDTAKKAKEIDRSVIDEEYCSKLEALVNSKDMSGQVNIPAPEDKDMRTKIHLFIKQTYPLLETKTVEIDGKKMIQTFFRKGKSRDSRRDEWPASKKSCRFVKFVLYKENKDTMDAIGLISKLLKIKENVFQYAGTKDKRARTSQEITANRVHPQKLIFLNKLLRNMGVGNLRYVEEPLKLGQLSGNQFTMVLRNVTAIEDVVDEALTSLKTNGFINYFGMQRFGTTSVPTHKIGSALLHGDWKKAINLILMPRNDFPNKAKFQMIWQDTQDASKTLLEVPRYCSLERNLLEGLKKKMQPFNALERISRNTRMLYVHSYQALIWNLMTSRRLAKLGHKPVIGDLVFSESNSISDSSGPLVLTKDNIEKYSIHDVVLPLPGHSVIYPKNEVHEWYREMLKDDGLDIDNMKRSQKDYSLPGAYRHITVAPTQVSWSHHQYDDYTLPLTLSDWDLLKKEKLPDPVIKGKFKAVVLQMILPPSCYATMALREVLKVDTSAAHQTSLNVT
ncbi:pseudouridylate synthase 7 homolog [Plakobranchus ocellatus]|uniref:Pseudouridylate synthase 7 homolog n=1 Tax=Plakobranchus ocellatus TaxID=259542 RepID=A0AAV3XZE4_9GAST|nr:pseudouridylate synthase 7 homolog [Plakobranchus ocellatus]